MVTVEITESLPEKRRERSFFRSLFQLHTLPHPPVKFLGKISVPVKLHVKQK